MKTLFIAIVLASSAVFASGEILRTPELEVQDAIAYLNKIPEADQIYCKFFSTYAIPPELRNDAVLTLSFLLHSMTGISDSEEGNAGAYYPLARMENREIDGRIFVPQISHFDAKGNPVLSQVSPTLWAIDIRNFNCTPQSWENMANLDGYFAEPVVRNTTNGALRLKAGNAVLRADWFIYNATNKQRQVDLDENVRIYDELVYSYQKTKPKTLDDIYKVWHFNPAELRGLGDEYMTLVAKSRDVARHNRILAGYRTPLGWWYSSYDVKNEQGSRDYIEYLPQFHAKPPPATAFDASELIFTNQLGLQVYDIVDNKGKRLDSADLALVHHIADVLGDPRVSVAHSCYDCHSGGLIPSQNVLKTFTEHYGVYKTYPKADQLRYDRAYLSNRFEESVVENNVSFARALYKTNGLTPDENAKAYLNLIKWYNTPLDIAQCALECGVNVNVFIAKMSEGRPLIGNGIVPGRIALLIQDGTPVDREAWETRGRDGIPGIFDQCMIGLNGLTATTTTTQTTEKVLVPVKATVEIIKTTKLIWRATDNTNKTKDVQVGDRFEPTGHTTKDSNGKDMTGVIMQDGKSVWVPSADVKIVAPEKK